MKALPAKEIQVKARYQIQNAGLAIHDVYDAAVELITNSDDRYQRLGTTGRIEIEVRRQRGGQPDVFRVRDFADGMTAKDMDEKLAWRGGQVSGLESGQKVRGTNSRGAKDIAVLGTVTFQSIKDGQYHKCRIQKTKFTPYRSEPATDEIRAVLGIPSGTGMVVTLDCSPTNPTPQHSTLVENLARLVVLRQIVSNPKRPIVVRDLNQDREEQLAAPRTSGKDRLKETFAIPNYEGAKAKLIVKRADQQFSAEKGRFRQGGIVVKSRHAIHESTLFDSHLEHDQHAQWFVGLLTCDYIDVLWNQYDDFVTNDLEPPANNPMAIFDPLRQGGLTRQHPFVKALFAEVLKRLRPLVEEERSRAEKERATIENKATRRRLNKLEQAAAKFMDQERDDDEPTRDPSASRVSRKLQEDGYALNPPFKQFVRGETSRCWLNVRQKAFPEIEVGTTVHIECLTDEVASDTRAVGLELNQTDEGLLQAVWKVTAVERTAATGIRVQAGPIRAEATFEVFDCLQDKYAHIKDFTFSSKRYRVSADGKPKKIRIYCPLHMVSAAASLDVACSNKRVRVGGDKTLVPREEWGVAVCNFHVSAKEADFVGRLTARFGDHVAEAEVYTEPPRGAGIKIEIVDIDLVDARYRWRQNVLELAAKHPSLRRYLGPESEGFAGQDLRHFRLLIAEIVADAVCAKVVESREARLEYEEGHQHDWNFYYAEYSHLMTQFLPVAHALQVEVADTG